MFNILKHVFCLAAYIVSMIACLVGGGVVLYNSVEGEVFALCIPIFGFLVHDFYTSWLKDSKGTSDAVSAIARRRRRLSLPPRDDQKAIER